MTDPILICFDFDGTLVDKHGRIHPQDVEILQTEKRVQFVPATGRSLQSVRHAFERNGLFTDSLIPFPMILHNGAVTYLPGEVLSSHTPFPAPQQTQLLEISLRYAQICCILFSLNRLDVLWPNPEAQKVIERFNLDVQPFQLENQQVTKITYIAVSTDAMQGLAAEVTALQVEASYSLPTVLELNKAGVNKGLMLKQLLSDLGMQSATIIAAGDGENDLSLFQAAHKSFCPLDSPAAIRAQADVQIDLAQAGLLAPILTDLFR